MTPEIILASQSPFRKMLLQQVAIDFKSISPDVDERQLEKEFSGTIFDLPQYLALKKAESVLSDFPKAAVIGSDQVLIFEGKTLAKPNTLDEVKHRLTQLQGKSHELHTGLCLHYQNQALQHTTVARLTMHPLNQTEINNYSELDKPLGCAGGYKIEQRGPLLFSKIETDDYYSIIGLPLLSLVAMLRKIGISGL